MKFRLKPNVGVHVGSVGQDAEGNELPAAIYGPGAVVESTKRLSDIWPEKWEEVHESTPAQGVVGKQPAAQPAAATTTPPTTAPNITAPILGPTVASSAAPAPAPAPAATTPVSEDVTSSFPLAVKANLQVWGNEQNGYAVRELDIPNAKAINTAPLSREEMEKFLESYTAE